MEDEEKENANKSAEEKKEQKEDDVKVDAEFAAFEKKALNMKSNKYLEMQELLPIIFKILKVLMNKYGENESLEMIPVMFEILVGNEVNQSLNIHFDEMNSGLALIVNLDSKPYVSGIGALVNSFLVVPKWGYRFGFANALNVKHHFRYLSSHPVIRLVINYFPKHRPTIVDYNNIFIACNARKDIKNAVDVYGKEIHKLGNVTNKINKMQCKKMSNGMNLYHSNHKEKKKDDDEDDEDITEDKSVSDIIIDDSFDVGIVAGGMKTKNMERKRKGNMDFNWNMNVNKRRKLR